MELKEYIQKRSFKTKEKIQLKPVLVEPEEDGTMPVDPILDKRAEEVREALLQVRKDINKNYVKLVQLCYEAWKERYYKKWGYSSFVEFVETELGLRWRRVYYFLNIAKAVENLGLKWEEIQEIGWKKASEIAPVLKLENAREWLEKAKKLGYRELHEEVRKIKAQKKKKKVKYNPVETIESEDNQQDYNFGEVAEEKRKLTFNLDNEQFYIVMTAIEQAKSEGYTSEADCLVHICYEWLQSVLKEN